MSRKEREPNEVDPSHVDARALRTALCAWGTAHFRDFPWRQTRDPYALLVAEIMLHRTQARQVAPIYRLFLERFPTLEQLAAAAPAQIMQVLLPLGLHWRSELLLEMIDVLMRDWHGEIPQAKTDLLALPGVSDYIASALRCFAWDLPDVLIDTNTVRVIGRVFGLAIKPSSRRNRLFRETLTAMIDPSQPRCYNFALLDLAAQVCRPANPLCEQCPILQWCLTGQQRDFPVLHFES